MFTPVNVPAFKRVPAVDASYQSTVVPVAAVADNVTVPVPQRVALSGAVATAGAALTVADTVNRVADIQPPDVFLACAK